MRRLLWSGLLMALCASVALAQSTTGSVYGTVTTADGLVIEGVTVNLESGHAASKDTFTGARGTFRFGELPIGEFKMTFSKQGYQTIVVEGVMVRLGLASRVDIVMEASATEQVITITGEAALVDMKKTGTSSQLTQDYLANIPSARDPWVILDQLPGINTDRVNVGGSESGQQSNFVSKGDDGDNAMWNVDGVTITDQASLSSPGYYDFDAFEEMQITTSGADASIQTAGVAMNFITKQGSDTFHGQGSVYYTGESLQDSNLTDELEEAGYSGNQIDSIKDYGFDVGGPIWKGNIWFWGAYHVQDITLLTISGTTDATKLENINLKFTGQAGDQNRWTFFYTRGDKVKSGRGASVYRPAECTWDQEGPTPIYKVEDTFMATENLIISGKFAYVGGGFSLYPQGGLDAIPTYDYATGMYGGTSYYYDTKRPQYQVTLTGEYYVDQAFGGSHEIKAGFEWRKTPVTSLSGYGVDMLLALYNGEPVEVWLTGKVDARKVAMRTSFYLMDIFSLNRWTFNFGVRYDHQWAYNKESNSTGNSIIPDLIPDLDFGGTETVFKTTDFMPRLGMTYDLFGDGKTIIRGNFSMYGDQIYAGIAEYMNPLGWREVDYEWTDTNGDGLPSADELGDITWWYGVNPYGTDDPLETPYTIDTDELGTTYEVILGIEREISPQIAVSGTYVYRYFNDFNWLVDDNWIDDPYTLAGTVTQSGYTEDYYEPTTEAAGTSTLSQRPDYHRVYQGIEVQATKRLADRWMANLSFSYGDTKVYYDSDAAYTDPTSIEYYNGYSYAPETSGSGKTSIFMNSRWALKLTGMYQLPYDINVSGYWSFREGFVYPIRLRSSSRAYSAGYAYPLVEGIGENHLDNLMMLDMRVEKVFSLPEIGRLSLIMDIFNVFNSNHDARPETATPTSRRSATSPRSSTRASYASASGSSSNCSTGLVLYGGGRADALPLLRIRSSCLRNPLPAGRSTMLLHPPGNSPPASG